MPFPPPWSTMRQEHGNRERVGGAGFSCDFFVRVVVAPNAPFDTAINDAIGVSVDH